MSQNRSSAVMQQRHEAPTSLDDFPTPPWATRALCEALIASGLSLMTMHAWEPACNRGYMARVLSEYFDHVHATDVHAYGWDGQAAVSDFLIDWAEDAPDVDIVITNPPFRLARDFILQGLRYAPYVAVLVRSAFDEGQDRYETLFRDTPEFMALPFVERVTMWQGVLLDPDVPVWRWDKPDPDDQDAPRTGKLIKPATATAYQWLVFKRGHSGPAMKQRIAPCRHRLTLPGDYPPVPAHLLPPEGALL